MSSQPLDPEIAAHYALGLEQARLETVSRIEGVRTRELLARLLPPAPAVVLDVGGARALAWARRVLRPGGVVLAAAISRFASTFDGIHARALADDGFAARVAQTVADGEHRNPDGRPEWFTSAHFHHPDELWDELAVAGFAVEGVLGVEGPASFLTGRDEAWWLDDERRRSTLLDAIRRVEQEPSVLGASAHLLGVGRR